MARTLNTLEGDTSFVSLASNQFTLQPGTYHIEATAPAYRVSGHKIKLRQTSQTPADILIGLSGISGSTGDFALSNSIINGSFSISVATTFEIQHRVGTTKTTDGYGAALTYGDSEVYTQVKITKVL
jgi:hypothetical protein